MAEAVRLHASSAMDVSDGLIGDAMKLATASGAGLEIEAARVPLSPGFKTFVHRDPAVFEAVLTGGDDYQVLAAIPPEGAASFERAAREIAFPVTRIGRLTDAGVRVIGLDGRNQSFSRASFGHF
jgi:thiamine-monophosphate kinase